MKRIILLAISILLILSACSRPNPIPTATATSNLTGSPTQDFITSTPKPTHTQTPAEAAENWDVLKPWSTKIKTRELISPDGQWLVNTDLQYQHSTDKVITIPVISIESKQPNLSFPFPTSRNYGLDSWSPDGTAFVGIDFDPNKVSGRDDCCGEGVLISNFIKNGIETFSYHWGWNERPIISWSPDSSRIGILFLGKELRIIDRRAKLLETIPLEANSVTWAQDFIYASVHKDGHNKIFKINPINTKMDIVYEQTSDIAMFLDTYNTSNNQILLHRYLPNANKVLSFDIEYDLFDLGSNTIIPSVFQITENSIFNLKTSPFQKHIAITVFSDDYSELALWIFDWQNHTFKYYGQIEELLGWFTNVNGFLVITPEYKEVKIIKP